MALVADKEGGQGQGSVNARLYALAAASPGLFHATPSGNNSVPGVQGFTANGATYNLATGLGSVDGAQLVNGWSGSSTSESTNPDFDGDGANGDTHRRQLGDAPVRCGYGRVVHGQREFQRERPAGAESRLRGPRIRSRRLRAQAPMRCCLRSRRRSGQPGLIQRGGDGDGRRTDRRNHSGTVGAQRTAAPVSAWSLRAADRCRARRRFRAGCMDA